MKRIADEELRKMGIVIKDINQPIGPCPAASGNASRLLARCTSVPGS